jgi:hypothetical protein
MRPLAAYAARMRGEEHTTASRQRPRWTDDDWAQSVAARPSGDRLTFGCPERDCRVASRLRLPALVHGHSGRGGTARGRGRRGRLVAQGAGGRPQGSFDDRDSEPRPLLALLEVQRRRVARIAAGGSRRPATSRPCSVWGVPAQIRSALLLATEADTSPVHRRRSRATPGPSSHGRSGRCARGIVCSSCSSTTPSPPAPTPRSTT